ncbi:30S ribosomal protein S21 [Spatholobus suberectus]|nr:30S ribosomal protein S21 [Spatholobus suberectus]
MCHIKPSITNSINVVNEDATLALYIVNGCLIPFSTLFSFLLPVNRALSHPSFLRSFSASETRCPAGRTTTRRSCPRDEPLCARQHALFRSAYNVQVVVDENEPEERLLNRFRREVMRAGVIQECKRRRFFENKQEEKKRKSREAAKRKSRSRRPLSRYPVQNKQDVATTKKEEDDDDNWDLPEVDAPYI